ncbi:MAG: hypothetical protein IJC40_06200 [Muribaculaceae bacterium]|nr:hypothetical protein [Muribaculaceae bacterium]
MAESNENKTQISAEQLEAEKLKAAKIKKIAMWSSIGVGAIAIGILVYIFVIRNPQEAAGYQQLAKVEAKKVEMYSQNGYEVAVDSLKRDTVINLYKSIAADNNFAPGNLAGMEAAILMYQKGDYKGALAMLEDVDHNEEVIGSACYSLQGDCYVNLGKDNYDNALECYDDAIDQADENPWLVPVYLIKKANIYREKGEFENEFAAYETIKASYPQYYNQYQIEKYYQRAKASAGK